MTSEQIAIVAARDAAGQPSALQASPDEGEGRVTDAARIERLPKWAQSEIQVLRRNLKASREELSAALGSKETSVEVEPYRHLDGQPRCFLEPRTTVRFTLSGGEIDVRLRDGRLELMSCNRGPVGMDFTARPRAANVLWVGFDPEPG